MTYTPSWTNGNGSGRLVGGTHWIDLDDAQDIADAVRRRMLLTYWSATDYSADLVAGAYPKTATFNSFRYNIVNTILHPTPGALGGSPASPLSMKYLWPGDTTKQLVSGTAGAGEISLFDELTGTGTWTDPTLSAGGTFMRAVHHNELRQALEWIHLGKWVMPIYIPWGIFSLMPNNPWGGGAVANNGTDEVRVAGWANMSIGSSGLINVSALSSSKIVVTADTACSVTAYACNIDFGTYPTWNSPWSSPGGLGDCTLIGGTAVSPGSPGTIGVAASALQPMIDGGEQKFLFRRSDSGPETISITATLHVDFDLDTPPN